ncbi:RNA-binding domain-containing protein [Candidatus Poriferisodalis sp.]|uniref:RNA-binding domain-containing protein n=1 Tax=Candidatus Poriferisodalis sp. TaxID=3101277 RepID=UPI003B022492
MDAAALSETIALGETLTVEFKPGGIDRDDLAAAVVCLANSDGGRLLLGVSDDGEVVGIDPDKRDYADRHRLAAVIANRTEPAILTGVEMVALGGQTVAVIEVPSTDAVHATSKGRYLRRTIDVNGEPQCLPMAPHEVLARASGAIDHSRRAVDGLSADDLDGGELARMRGLARQGGDDALASLSDADLVRALNLMEPSGRLTIGALLLFGTTAAITRYLPGYEVGFQELAGTEIKSNEISRAPLLRAMEQLVDRVEARNPEEDVEVGLFRVALPRYAKLTIRELVANALVHRDYTELGPTLVQVDGGVLAISNPGGFPRGVTIDNLLTTMPRPRNPAIADAFKRSGLVDRIGRGINRVFEHQLSLGRPAPDYTASNSRSVVARVRSGPADAELAGYIAQSRRSGHELGLEDLITLHEVRAERRITTERAAELFQVDHASARATLNSLVERGLLESRGERKARTYHMAAALYRQLGEPAQYVRTKGFDEIQQREMIHTFVERHGSISRREASELCQLSPAQAGRLLRRLRDDGVLAMVGERRGARYLLPTSHLAQSEKRATAR